jgi:hypothetical protein
LQISADPIQLKAFLNVLKNELCPLNKNEKTGNSLLRAFGTTNKIPQQMTEMTIKERSSFPSTGLPRTLKKLKIIDISLSQMPIGILNLTNLTSLDLSNNSIVRIPKELGRLKLISLILNKNKLGKSRNLKDWSWLDGEGIRTHLCDLKLSNNCLKFIPSNLFKCTSVNHLDLSFNGLERISFAIKQMSSLKVLNFGHNLLKSFPYTITKLGLTSIDISWNKFPLESSLPALVRINHQKSQQQQIRAPTLLEIAARVVLKHQIPYLNHRVPLVLEDILVVSPVCCNPKCEALCFDMEVYDSITIIQLNSKERCTSDNISTFPADGGFCSRFCKDKVFKKLLLYQD